MKTAEIKVRHIDDNPLAIQIRKSDVGEETSLSLLNAFTPFFEQAEEWKARAEGIVVTDASQIDEMAESRKIRLALKKILVETEKTRKNMKEESLRKGNAIDGISNVIKFLFIPIMNYLQVQEDFIKLEEERKKNELRDKRIEELSQYDVETEHYPNLGEMPEEGYQQLLRANKAVYENRKEAERKSEEELIAKEAAEATERERIRKENERLKKEAEKREREEAERKIADEAERAKADEKLHREREAREKAETKLKVQKETEEKKRLIEQEKKEAERKAKEKSEKDARLAPDKKKLELLASKITGIEMPDVTSKEARDIIKGTVDLLNKTSNYIKEKSCNL